MWSWQQADFSWHTIPPSEEEENPHLPLPSLFITNHGILAKSLFYEMLPEIQRVLLFIN